MYQGMVHIVPTINVKTIGLLFQVTLAHTKPKLVWIIGNLRRDKLVNQRGWEVLHCTVKNQISLWYRREKLNFVEIQSLKGQKNHF